MKPKFLVLLVITTLAGSRCLAQKAAIQMARYYKELQQSFDSSQAFQTVEFVEKRWRLAGNTGFNESIHYVESILLKAGYTKETKNEKEAVLTYRIEKRPLRRPAWEPVDASVTIAGEAEPLLSFSSNRNMLAINSGSTPAGGVEAELIPVKSAKELDTLDIKGKIVFGETYIQDLYATATEHGALGVMFFRVPAYNQPAKHINSISFQSIPYKDSISQKWAILLSYAASEKLKTAVRKGRVILKVNVVSRFIQSEELTLVANIRGSIKPDERFVFSAHVQEPGANDNASGVGALAEMARVSAQFVKQGKLKPKRTITFLWGDEIVSTNRYIKDDSVRARGILWGMSLDMVGEDTKKTGGSFLIEKMPDPSAVWTRGEEKHTEWGGSPMKESDIRPHYFNDYVLNRCLDRARQNNWIVKTNPFEGGSDHTPFLNARKPGLLLWHFTDVYYHTDADRIDKVSAEELKNVGIAGLVAAYMLVSADQSTTMLLIKEIESAAKKRLDTELALSIDSVRNGGDRLLEKHILEVWAKYYEEALAAMTDINVGGNTAAIAAAIRESQTNIKSKLNNCLTHLAQ
jgi:aminopeptidase YwaD